MKTLKFLMLSILFLSSCDKFDWHNPYDPECPKELFTPSSPGATMEGNSVKLTWSQQNDDISGFALFRSAEGESIANLTQTQKSTTQFIDANITPGKKYTYYVVAVAGTNKSDTVKAEIIPVIPVTISTGSVTELAATSAKVSGNITSAGGGAVTSRGICWSTTPNQTVNSSKTTEGTGAGQFTSTLSNLLAATTYYARAYGENSRGISYGSEINFTTLGPPKLTTTAVSNITATTATSGGTIISDGGSPITAKGVVWSTSPSPTIDLSTKTNDGTGVGAFTSSLSNLTNNTKYYFRAYATNIVGTSYSEEFSFTTSAPIPPVLESLKQGLVAFYPFNGNAGDSSGNGNHGAVFGATSTTDRFGNLNKSFSFNGVSNYVTVPFSQSFNTIQSGLTMSAWVYMQGGTGSATPPRILELRGAYGGGGDAGFVMLAQSNSNISRTFEVRWYNNGGNNNIYVSPTNSVDAMSWKLVTFTCDGANALGKFYVNGVLINTNANMQFQGVINSCNYNNNPLYIGGEPFLLGMWGGKIDDLRIYNRALTQEEITYLANN
jgi:hypothetical protein